MTPTIVTLSVACLVSDKCHYCKENNKLKRNCPCHKWSHFFCKLLSVVGVLEEDCHLFLDPCHFYPLEGLSKVD